MTETIIAVTRSCVACGEPERDGKGQPLYFRMGHTPRGTRCERCGLNMLMIEEAERRIVRTDPEIDWSVERPRIGRPTNAMRAARATEAEGLKLRNINALRYSPQRDD